jgi:hypothetical protein
MPHLLWQSYCWWVLVKIGVSRHIQRNLWLNRQMRILKSMRQLAMKWKTLCKYYILITSINASFIDISMYSASYSKFCKSFTTNSEQCTYIPNLLFVDQILYNI